MKLRELIKLLGPIAILTRIQIKLPDDMEIALTPNQQYHSRGFRVCVTAYHDGEILDEAYWERIDWDTKREFCGIKLNTEEWTLVNVSDIKEAIAKVQDSWNKLMSLVY